MDYREDGWGERLMRALSGEPEPDGKTAVDPAPPVPSPTVLAWWLWFTAIVLILAGALALSGCASAPVPPCGQWRAATIEDDDGQFAGIFVDPENIARLYALVQGLAHGTCRLPAPPLEVKGEART